jgi:hypothetical protein
MSFRLKSQRVQLSEDKEELAALIQSTIEDFLDDSSFLHEEDCLYEEPIEDEG